MLLTINAVSVIKIEVLLLSITSLESFLSYLHMDILWLCATQIYDHFSYMFWKMDIITILSNTNKKKYIYIICYSIKTLFGGWWKPNHLNIHCLAHTNLTKSAPPFKIKLNLFFSYFKSELHPLLLRIYALNLFLKFSP